ncbi:MAG TPA: vitamin K epoxide reductase family protein [Solirubrobacteraceae bacterium]|nr:vitamin K epoxide reductase family protein [Solirubrobacteraceae bacterium]
MSDARLRRTSTGLGVAGVGIAGYLTYVHYAGLHPICGISHGCETVQTSVYSTLFGIPVALLGLITYVLILITLRRRDDNALLAGYVLTLIAFGFSLYLTYREVFTIHAICSWCVSSAIVFTLLAIVGTLRVFRIHGGAAWTATEPA